jgi:two-component system, NarL family, nitrate/nitrite response regulator NarL
VAEHAHTGTITVGLTDDHLILTDALTAMLGAAPDLEVLFAAGDCAGLRAALLDECPDVLLLDVGLPDGDGIDMLPEIHALCPHASVLVLTSLGDEDTLMRALDGGVSGFLPKRQSLADLQDSIRQAAAGEMVVPGSLLRGLLNRRRRRHGRVTPGTAPLLTARERQILELLVQGKTGPEIAGALTISPATVRTHIGNLMSKMNVHSRLQAVAYALSHGMVERPS